MAETLPEVRVLGRVEIAHSGGVEIPATSKVGPLLVCLLVDRGVTVSVDRLVDVVGDHHQNATRRLQANLRNVRKLFPTSSRNIVVHDGVGYRLNADMFSVDSDRFELLVNDARDRLQMLDPAAANRALREALGLWRGPCAFGSLTDDHRVQAEVRRLDEVRVEAASMLAELAVERGRISEGDLDAIRNVARDHPAAENLARALMRAFYAADRPDAVDGVLAELRRGLADLDLEPHPDTLRLARRIADDTGLPSPTAEIPTNVVEPTSRLIGRDALIDHAVTLVGERRVVTLIGAAGTGVSEVLRRVAWRARPAFPGGVFLVDLQAVGDPASVQAELGQIVASCRGKDLIAALARGRVLVVFDGAAPETVNLDWLGQLVVDRKSLSLLLSSEAPLDVLKEQVIEVSLLDLPTLRHTKTQMLDLPIARLVAHHAGTGGRKGGGLPKLRKQQLYDLLHLTKGKPALAQLLGRRLGRSGFVSIFDWKADAAVQAGLSWDEQLALAAVSVFPGDFSFDAARAVVERDADVVVDRLADLGLVERTSTVATQQLFRLTNVIRTEAGQLLRDFGLFDETVRRLIGWLAETATPDTANWLLRREGATVTMVLDAAFERGNHDEGVAIVAAFGDEWVRTLSRLGAGVPWLTKATTASVAPSESLSDVWRCRGRSAVRRGEFAEAEGAFTAAAAVADEVGAVSAAGWARAENAHLNLMAGRFDDTDLLDRAEEAADEAGDRSLLARATLLRAQRALYLGDLASSRFDALRTSIVDPKTHQSDVAHASVILATEAQMRGDFEAAVRIARAARLEAEGARDGSLVSFADYRLASAYRAQGMRHEAVASIRRGFPICRAVEHLGLVASMLQVSAGLAMDAGDVERSYAPAAAHTTIRKALGFELNAVDAMEAAEPLGLGDLPPMSLRDAIDIGWTHDPGV